MTRLKPRQLLLGILNCTKSEFKKAALLINANSQTDSKSRLGCMYDEVLCMKQSCILLAGTGVTNVRIFHDRKSIPRIAVWQFEACRVMTNCDPEGRIFLSFPHANNGFFFLLTTVYILFILK